MSWPLIAAIFITLWCVALFLVLPFGNAPARDVQAGHAVSAPARPRLAVKFLVTTVLAAVATAFVVWLKQSNLLSIG